MSHIDAVYRHGVFEPLEPVDLREEQRVHLSFEPQVEESPQGWLNKAREIQAKVVRREGTLPDSTLDIATDRLR